MDVKYVGDAIAIKNGPLFYGTKNNVLNNAVWRLQFIIIGWENKRWEILGTFDGVPCNLRDPCLCHGNLLLN